MPKRVLKAYIRGVSKIRMLPEPQDHLTSFTISRVKKSNTTYEYEYKAGLISVYCCL